MNKSNKNYHFKCGLLLNTKKMEITKPTFILDINVIN